MIFIKSPGWGSAKSDKTAFCHFWHFVTWEISRILGRGGVGEPTQRAPTPGAPGAGSGADVRELCSFLFDANELVS